jgi:hypothetical protein
MIQCKTCDKIGLKNNWPLDKFKYNKCDNCYKKCVVCKKTTSDYKAIKKNNKRHCTTCIEKTAPIGNYKMVVCKDSLIKQFIKWRLIKSRNKSKLIKPIEKKIITKEINKVFLYNCKKCDVLITSNNKLNILNCCYCNPTTNLNNYKYDKINNEWTLYKKN